MTSPTVLHPTHPPYPDLQLVRSSSEGSLSELFGTAASDDPAAPGLMVSGELDLATAPALLAAAAGEMAVQSPPLPGADRRFVLDLDGVRFLDSAGVEALADVDRRVRAVGHDLQVVGPCARGPVRLLAFAVERGWLPPVFTRV